MSFLERFRRNPEAKLVREAEKLTSGQDVQRMTLELELEDRHRKSIHDYLMDIKQPRDEEGEIAVLGSRFVKKEDDAFIFEISAFDIETLGKLLDQTVNIRNNEVIEAYTELKTAYVVDAGGLGSIGKFDFERSFHKLKVKK